MKSTLIVIVTLAYLTSSTYAIDLFGSSSSANSQQLTFARRIYNSSIALTVPLFSFKIPNIPNGGFIVNQAIFGAFAFGIVALTFGLSFIFTGSEPAGARSFQKRLFNKNAKSNTYFWGQDLSQSMGMDGLECVKKAVCQAYEKNYGLIGVGMRRMLDYGWTQQNNETITSPIRLAALRGMENRSAGAEDDACESNYDCILDPLGSTRYLVGWYGHKLLHRNDEGDGNKGFLSGGGRSLLNMVIGSGSGGNNVVTM